MPVGQENFNRNVVPITPQSIPKILGKKFRDGLRCRGQLNKETLKGGVEWEKRLR